MAIERIGGRGALLAQMRTDDAWRNPERTVETWLERQRISGQGIRFIWSIAHGKKIVLEPSDFDVCLQDKAAA